MGTRFDNELGSWSLDVGHHDPEEPVPNDLTVLEVVEDPPNFLVNRNRESVTFIHTLARLDRLHHADQLAVDI